MDTKLISTKYIKIPIEVNSNHRPRFNVKTGKAHMDKDYGKIKSILTSIFKGKAIRIDNEKIKIDIPKADYFGITIYFFFPYRYKKAMKDEKHRKTPDWDNLVKPVQDALVKANVLKDDGQISDAKVKKRWSKRIIYPFFIIKLKGYVN
jgi:Holliday junction resolvase RusA-like endonuclease